MKTVFFTWITNDFKDTIIDFNGFYKSFKYFHPDIDLVVFDDTDIQKLYAEKPWLYSDNCKASFAKLLYNDYDLVVNVDSDFYFFDRLHEVLEADYDIAASANFNLNYNTILLPREIEGYKIPLVNEINYIQGGLVASTSKEFWDEYEIASRDLARSLPLRDNDVLNMIWYSGNYNTKILDGSTDYRDLKFTKYYNCSSLGREKQTHIIDNKVYLKQKQMASYHVANGHSGPNGAPKRRYYEIFPTEVSEWFKKIIDTDLDLNNITKRIYEITYNERLSHLSSCISAAPIIHEIYNTKKDDEIFILSNGHAGLALYCVLENRYGIDPVMLLHKHGIHPGKDLENKLYCSTGSLGSGLPIAVGHALADRSKNVYCMISDGEAAEGSIWEALRFVHIHKLDNLKIYVNINGMSAYEYLDKEYLINRLKSFLPTINIRDSEPVEYEFAKGLLTHYYVMKPEDYSKL